MAYPDSEERIRDLEQRMEAMPGSRIFVGLAEEYRRAGRYEDALNTLQKGLQAHPTYLSAQIALARLYQETWRTQEAIEAFLKVLAMDRENLVAAKALSELYENSRNPVEAIKKLKLYRAISGDKAIDEKIARMEREIHAEIGDTEAEGEPPPPAAAAVASEPAFAVNMADFQVPASLDPNFDPNQTMSIGIGQIVQYEAIGAPERPTEEVAARSSEDRTSPPVPLSNPTPAHATPPPQIGEGSVTPPAPTPAPEIPPSRTLADLYYTQGFVSDARKIYEKLAVANPMDESVTRRLRVLRNPARTKSARLERWIATIRSRAAAGRA